MKKIIYTLLFGLFFVACDKGNDNLDMQLITPLEATMVDNTTSSELVNARFDAFNDFLRGTSFKAVPNKPSPSTSKGGDNGADWIEVVFFEHTSDNYVYTRPDGLGNSCHENIGNGVSNVYVETYSYRADTQMVNIQIGDTDATTGERAIPADLQPQYEAAFAATDSALFFADLSSDVWSFRLGALPSITVND